jgi:hypothetical protein
MRTVTIMLVVVAVYLAPAASACSCRTPPPPAEHFAQVDMVFKAKVVDIEHSSWFLKRIWLGLWMILRDGDIDDRRYCRDYGKRVDFEITEAWKGVQSRGLTLRTGRGSGDCGYEFEVGKTYLVYAYSGNDDTCNVSLCSRTGEIDEVTEDLAFLGSRAKLQLQ